MEGRSPLASAPGAPPRPTATPRQIHPSETSRLASDEGSDLPTVMPATLVVGFVDSSGVRRSAGCVLCSALPASGAAEEVGHLGEIPAVVGGDSAVDEWSVRRPSGGACVWPGWLTGVIGL
jgi:hypothetical protein